MHGEDEVGLEIACAICHEPGDEPVFPGAGGAAGEYPLVRCRRCGLVFQHGRPDYEELDAAQSDAYGEPRRRFGRAVEWGVRTFRIARRRMAERLMPSPGRVLDVGCGRGPFLEMLARRGHAVRGTELSAATAANACPDVPVDVGELTPGRYPPDSFDLVSVWHVLEHTRRPDEVLAAAHGALRPGGALMIAVPNLASAQARFGGEQWFHLDLPRHLFHFTPSTLAQLLESNGFTVERLTTGQWEMDPFGWLQTVLNRSGLRHNGLYDTLRNNERVKQDLSLPFRAGLILAFLLGMPPALLAAALCRLTGTGGTLIAVARRA